MQVGDLVKQFLTDQIGVVLAIEPETPRTFASIHVLWTEASTTDGQIFWQPTSKLEVINASR